VTNYISKDRNGIELSAGDSIRVLKIRPIVLARLGEFEGKEVVAILENPHQIFDIDADGQIWVNVVLDRGKGKLESQSFVVDSGSVEVVLAV
jgi:hypothetical protein